MKLFNLELNKSKLIKLQLIKRKIYKNKKNDKLEVIELHVKKMLQIIYSYHFQNKKIYFIGLPAQIQKMYTKTFYKTNHLFIPEFTWIKGVLSNRTPTFKYLYKQINIKEKTKNSSLNSLFTIYQKPDLVVLFDIEKESVAFQEAIKLRIPVVAAITNSSIVKNVSYPIFGDFRFVNRGMDNLFFILLNSILKR